MGDILKKTKLIPQEKAAKIAIAITTRGRDIGTELMKYIIRLGYSYKHLQVHMLVNPLCAFQNQAVLQALFMGDKRLQGVLLLDSDIVPTPSLFEDLYRCNKDIVAAPGWHYDRSRKDIHTNVHREHYRTRSNVRTKEGLVEVTSASFLAILIRKKVFDAFGSEPMFYIVRDGFDPHPEPSDVVFAYKARKKGFKIYVNTDMPSVGHYQSVLLTDETVDRLRDAQASYSVSGWNVLDELEKERRI